MFIKSMIKGLFFNMNPLFERNKHDIIRYNKQLIPIVFIFSLVTILIPMFFSLFRPSMLETLPAYLVIFSVIMLLLILFNFKPFHEKPLVFAYTFGIVFFIFVVYLSIDRFQSRPAGTALIFFVVAPLIFVDKPYKINIYLVLMFIIHTILSFQYKTFDIASVDLLNSFISLVAGMLFGRIFLVTRLINFDMHRALLIERETDFLTGLPNRRSLFEYAQKDTFKAYNYLGLMMFDIDRFKKYNDNYGHLNGDQVLTEFARLLEVFSKTYPVKFYRYGGEEFIGITYNLDKLELINLANHIKMDTFKLKVPFEQVTTSIGVTVTDKTDNIDINDLIEQADKALYSGKNSGRNKVIFYEKK